MDWPCFFLISITTRYKLILWNIKSLVFAIVLCLGCVCARWMLMDLRPIALQLLDAFHLWHNFWFSFLLQLLCKLMQSVQRSKSNTQYISTIWFWWISESPFRFQFAMAARSNDLLILRCFHLVTDIHYWTFGFICVLLLPRLFKLRAKIFCWLNLGCAPFFFSLACQCHC